jgi:hypothetical protein
MPGNTLIEMLDLSGCYAYDVKNKKVIDCDKARKTLDTVTIEFSVDKGKVYILAEEVYRYKGLPARSFMVLEFEKALGELKKVYGEEVVFELLKQALKPGYSAEELKAKIREIPTPA